MLKRYLLIDFRDSFTHNLAALLCQCGVSFHLVSYDMVHTLDLRDYGGLVLSPGPGHPSDYPRIGQVLQHFEKKPVFGVCLGFQIMACYSGLQVGPTRVFPVHGRVHHLELCNSRSRFFREKVQGDVILYNSLGVDPEQELFSRAWLSIGEGLGIVLAAESLYLDWLGLQFHPESYRTTMGELVLRRFFSGRT